MRAFFLNPADMSLQLREAPMPKPGPDQLLVRCAPRGLTAGEFLRHGLTKPGAPKVAGTEGAGEVEEPESASWGVCRRASRSMR